MIADLLQSSSLAAFLRCSEAKTVSRTCKHIHLEPVLAKRVTPAAREAEFYQDIRDQAEERREREGEFSTYSEYSFSIHRLW